MDDAPRGGARVRRGRPPRIARVAGGRSNGAAGAAGDGASAPDARGLDDGGGAGASRPATERARPTREASATAAGPSRRRRKAHRHRRRAAAGPATRPPIVDRPPQRSGIADAERSRDTWHDVRDPAHGTHRLGGAALGSLDAAREPERPGGGGSEAPCAGSAEAVLRHRARRARRRIDGRRAGDVWGPETSGGRRRRARRRHRAAGDVAAPETGTSRPAVALARGNRSGASQYSRFVPMHTIGVGASAPAPRNIRGSAEILVLLPFRFRSLSRVSTACQAPLCASTIVDCGIIRRLPSSIRRIRRIVRLRLTASRAPE